MALEIDKINVRSPYYVNVVGEAQDAPTAAPVTFSCGGTQNIGASVGVLTYEISASNRELGDYTVTISGIKVPIKYRIGVKGNLPAAYTTSDGWDNYSDAWEIATGETNAFSDSVANPNGLSSTATYTSTQSDLDTYGETLQLQILQPLLTEAYSLSLSCPAAKTAVITDVDAVGLNTLFLTIQNKSFPDNSTITLNGVSGVISMPTTGSTAVYKTTSFNHKHNENIYDVADPNYYPSYSSITKNVVNSNTFILGRNNMTIQAGNNSITVGGYGRPNDIEDSFYPEGEIILWWANHPLVQVSGQTYTYDHNLYGTTNGGQVCKQVIRYVGNSATVNAVLNTQNPLSGEGLLVQGISGTVTSYGFANAQLSRNTFSSSTKTF